MEWAAQVVLLAISTLGIYWYWTSRHEEDASDEPYNIAIRRFRIALLIGGIGGLLGFIRLWIKYRHGW
jgi:hypothetical protein